MRRGKAQLFASGPLFKRLYEKGPGAGAAFARSLNISQSRLTNWRTRGIPGAELPRVAVALGMSVEEYLQEAGAPGAEGTGRLTVALEQHEQQMLELYRGAEATWQLTLRLLAALPPEHQDAVAETLNALLAKLSPTTANGKLVPRVRIVGQGAERIGARLTAESDKKKGRK